MGIPYIYQVGTTPSKDDEVVRLIDLRFERAKVLSLDTGRVFITHIKRLKKVDGIAPPIEPKRGSQKQKQKQGKEDHL